MDPRAATRRWSQTWRDAWEALDVEAIVALYSPGSVLSTEPFRQPERGLDGVRRYVRRVFAEEEDPQVTMGDPLVEGDRAVVSWWASLIEDGAETTLAGTSMLRFDGEGLVLEQWDTWNQLPERRSPPQDWLVRPSPE